MNYNAFTTNVKYMLLGVAVGTVATILIASSPKLTNKIKDTTDNTTDNICSMFKIKK